MCSFENTRRTLWLKVLLAVAVFQTSGCTVGPKYQRPAAEVPPAYKEVGNWKPAQPNDQNLGGNWWTPFQDPQLDALELQVNVSNQNLKAAEAQYRQARAVVRYNRADYYPTVTAGASATRTRVSAHRPPPSSIFDGITYNDFVLPVDFSYQVDVWGRVRRTVESSREQAQASAADLATVNLSMHADLAIDYFLARSLDAEEQLLNSTVSQYEHAVAILIGKPPAEFSLRPLPLTAPPPNIPVSMPSELLERRPDIAAAERRVASANAQIGVAKSAYYPLINLGATGGFESSSITTLLNGPSGLWSFGFAAAQTIFDGGRRRAASDQAVAAYDQSVANYRQTVLTGFQQVEDNVAALRILEREAQTQDAAVVAAQKYLDLAVTRYKGGVTSYLEVTTAQNASLADQVTAVNLLGRRMVNSVMLIQALGGGWDRSALPERPECCGRLTMSSR